MKKGTLKLVSLLLAFLLVPVMQYVGKEISRGVGDVLSIFIVMVVLTALETNAVGLTFDSSDLIPQSIKIVVGVVMLLVLGSIFVQRGWFTTGYFNDPIILQMPLTMVDISVLVIIGTVLHWAGGITYQTVITVTTSAGNACYYILGKLSLVELEDDEENEAPTNGE